MSSYYKRWFPELTVIGHEDNIPHNLDLLILTGGEDIAPARYRQNANGASGWNTERDGREFNILDRVVSSGNGTKILGVCRGHQLLNVFYGGNLVQDMYSIGKDHYGVHNIVFKDSAHPLAWITKVNSLHHQALGSLGYGNGDTIIVAEEPDTRLIEMITWGTISLGCQFHPELWQNELGDRFFSIIRKWVLGEVSLLPPGYEFDHDDDEDDEDEEMEDEEMEDEEMEDDNTHTNLILDWSAITHHTGMNMNVPIPRPINTNGE